MDEQECLKGYCEKRNPGTRKKLMIRLDRIMRGVPLEKGYGGELGLSFTQIIGIGIPGTTGASMSGWQGPNAQKNLHL